MHAYTHTHTHSNTHKDIRKLIPVDSSGSTKPTDVGAFDTERELLLVRTDNESQKGKISVYEKKEKVITE